MCFFQQALRALCQRQQGQIEDDSRNRLISLVQLTSSKSKVHAHLEWPHLGSPSAVKHNSFMAMSLNCDTLFSKTWRSWWRRYPKRPAREISKASDRSQSQSDRSPIALGSPGCLRPGDARMLIFFIQTVSEVLKSKKNCEQRSQAGSVRANSVRTVRCSQSVRANRGS